jgi:hypothetical protein
MVRVFFYFCYDVFVRIHSRVRVRLRVHDRVVVMLVVLRSHFNPVEGLHSNSLIPSAEYSAHNDIFSNLITIGSIDSVA